ncbi:natural killer cell receptor 2B4-like isoform X2 [Grus americana]|uniref:natural killer cell receptor 2B4-like isoform X2 n=1 Tax=Grus americana TaxID=9117 RepID=UPI0024084BBB|nr:natural killer cell receptor 2B4-like isoform X2 [Grus americana]
MSSLRCHPEMHRHRGPRCPPALLVPLCLVLLAAASGQGPSECQERPVSVGGTLQLQPEKPPERWIKLTWRVRSDGGDQHWILRAEKNKSVQYSRVPVSGRAGFQEETVSLCISLVRPADSGVYWAEFEDTSGSLTHQCFWVSVWDPVGQPRLEAHILHQEQSWCNLSLHCTVPNTGNVSYNWSCTGDPPAALGHQPRLQLQVRGDTDPTVCCCNVSNPVSWSMASTDVVAACHSAASGGLPSGHDEQTLTVYEEVGKAQTGRDPNGTSEAMGDGNTIYAVVCTKTQGPSYLQDSERCTIYSTVQPTTMPTSLKRKRLDPALVSTAYVEATGGPRRWCPPSQTSSLGPAAHQLF